MDPAAPSPAAADPERGRGAQAYQHEHVAEAQTGALRAGIFGVNDGLVSNLGLVMGVAAGSEGRAAVLVAGIAGLLAGALSMAAGEYVSMRTQSEVLERELRVEREHIEQHPRQEQRELAGMLRANGLDDETADRVAAEVHRDIGPALGFHARFELGFAPEQLGSPIRAAVSSFLAFTIGALIPLLPFLLPESVNTAAVEIAACVLAAAGLIAVGVLATRVTGLSVVHSAGRQLLIGAVTAAITYGIGSLIGTAV